MRQFESVMAKNLSDFAAYRLQLGYARKAIKPFLYAFDRYLTERNATWEQLQPAFFLQMRTDIRKNPHTVNKILENAYKFYEFLIRRQICRVNPLEDIPPLPERVFIPFVFTPEQSDHLLTDICGKIRRCQKYLLFDMAIYLAVVMLARCGMRINEPLRLCRHHYRPDEGSVYIERTKFRKDRLIPLPQSAWVELRNYLSVREALRTEDENPYLLAARKNRPLNDYHVRVVFHRSVEAIGLKQPKRTMGNMTFGSPVPHSLRHSFAINTLNRIKARGISPQQALPVLAAYMGHRKYQYTAAYLKVRDASDVNGLIAFYKSQSVVK
jgi:integrase/recombinase XerD